MNRTEANAMLKESESKRAGTDSSCGSQIAEVVRQHLASSGHCALRYIEVQVDQRRVLLSGQVSSYFLKQTAQEVARAVCPDYQLKNLIVVGEHALRASLETP
ncbi:BON domain-containing protein [bacterium]|nr:BON domain-containing protein [bacterium]MDB4770575.1 BON domain-containing protein [bacterium]